MKFFNTAGPCRPDRHYMLPAEPRLPDVRRLVERGQYFVLHAPRQTGKTTTLDELAHTLTTDGRFAAVRFSCERGKSAGDDDVRAQQDVLQAIRRAARDASLPPDCRPPEPWPKAAPGSLLHEGLSEWAAACPLPLVLFFDEIDALRGKSLISVLAQLRDGATARSASFPHSVALCGLRDVRDYKAASGGDPSRLGTSSPFNIKAKSFRLTDFTFAEVAELYAQHTDATGQRFTPEAVQRAFEASQGQPWLVNALAAEVIDEMGISAEAITDEHMDEAVERLIVTRATHLDSLVARLHEPRVRRIMEPLVAGSIPEHQATDIYNDDVSYLRDLGLITRRPPARVANPIYQEVIVRVLAQRTEDSVEAEPRSFVASDGRLDFARLLAEFAAFWKQHGEILATRKTYHGKPVTPAPDVLTDALCRSVRR